MPRPIGVGYASVVRKGVEPGLLWQGDSSAPEGAWLYRSCEPTALSWKRSALTIARRGRCLEVARSSCRTATDLWPGSPGVTNDHRNVRQRTYPLLKVVGEIQRRPRRQVDP